MSASGAYEDHAAVGRRIGQARRELGFTQADLASRIGVPLGLLDRYESGKTDPSGKLAQIAEVTGRRVSWFTEPDPVRSKDHAAELPAALGRRIAESRVQRGVTRREQAEERLAAALGERSSWSPMGGPAPRAVDRPDVADIDPDQPDEQAGLAQRRDELQVALDEERRRRGEGSATGARLEQELESVNASQRALADALEQSRSELAVARTQEAQLGERVSQLETQLRAGEERAAEVMDRLARAETELQRSREQERSKAEELELRETELRVRLAELDTGLKALARAQTTVDDRRRNPGDLEFRAAAVAVAGRKETAGRPESDPEHRAGVFTGLERRMGRRRPGKSTSAAQGVEDLRSGRTDEHLAIVPNRGYRLVRRQGAAPDPGAIVELDDGRYRCVRITSSPFPGDDRSCAVLEPLTARSEP